MQIKHIVYTLISLLLMSLSATAQTKGDDVGNLIISAVTEINNGNHKVASDILQKVVAADQTNDAAWYYLAICSIAAGDLEMAEVHFGKAVELDPGNFWYRYRLAGVYANTSRPGQTIEIYEKLLADFPKKSELYFDMVELYSSQGENEKALKTLEEIETVFGMTESATVYKFNLLMRMKKQEEAFAVLEQYNRKYSSPYVLATLADNQLSMYNDSTALAYYNEALDIAPDYAPALLGKAETLRMTRKYGEYFDVLNDFVRNPSDIARSKTDYLSALIQRVDPKFLRSFASQMDGVIENTIKAHPADSAALHLAGLYYYTTDRIDLAKEKFRTNAELNPASISAAASWIEFLMYVKEWKVLADEGRKAYGRFPQEMYFIEMASVGNYNLQEYDKVLEICDEILQKAPADSSKTLRAWSTKGDVYHLLGEKNKSYKAYEKALKINPDYVYVLNNYAYYLSMEGKQLKKALTMSKKTIDAEPDNATYLDTYGWILFLMGKPEEAKPHFKHAMLYGGKESVVILDHYAEVLFALGEYDRAMVYWNQALRKNNGEIKDLDDRIDSRRQQMKTKTGRK